MNIITIDPAASLMTLPSSTAVQRRPSAAPTADEIAEIIEQSKKEDEGAIEIDVDDDDDEEEGEDEDALRRRSTMGTQNLRSSTAADPDDYLDEADDVDDEEEELRRRMDLCRERAQDAAPTPIASSPPDAQSDTDSDSTDDGLDNSISLTDLKSDHGGGGHSYSSAHAGGGNGASCRNRRLSVPSIAEDDNDDSDGDDSSSPLPQPPNHFLCKINNTLLCDPVIDREGNTYERDAILRWLVLTAIICDGESSDIDDDGNANKKKEKSTGGGGSTSEGETATGSEASLCLGRGTSPVTGNPVSVEELVEDKLVKSAIERWRKECWVRFLLRNQDGDDNDEIERLAMQNSHARGEGMLGGGGRRVAKKIALRVSLIRKKGRGGLARSLNHSEGGGNTLLAGVGNGAAIISPSPSSAASVGSLGSGTGKPHNQLLLRKSSAGPRQENLRSGAQPIGRSRAKKAGLTSSQRTAVTSNTTPTGSKPSHPSAIVGTLPSLPLGNSNSSARRSSLRSTNLSPPPAGSTASAVVEGAPVANVIPAHVSSGNSICSNLTNPYDMFSFPAASIVMQPRPQHNGWSVPLGVHKVVGAAPGLRVTAQVHRRSAPVRLPRRAASSGGAAATAGDSTDLVIPPGSYVEILETQVHGERVRGRISWEHETEEEEPRKKGRAKGLKRRTSRLLRRTAASRRKLKIEKSKERAKKVVVTRYEGWISLQWAKEEKEEEDEGESNGVERGIVRKASSAILGQVALTDVDAGPWTEPVPLGVYRINFGGGLPLRETLERDSTVLGKLDRGRCVEVVQTQVKGDRVRARVIVPNAPKEDENGKKGMMKFTSGWISLLNALTGSSGASPVPLGAYVVVADPGCVITEGGRLDSKPRGTLVPGSCMEVVATRMEEGVVRGLIASGGHVTLFVPPGTNRADARGDGSNDANGKTPDGGRMFAMPVPLGTYQIIKNGLSVTAGISSASSIAMKLPFNSTAEIVETRVEDGRVRGRVSSVVNEDGSKVVGYERAGSSMSDNAMTGWIHLFEPNQRWAKIVCFKGGRPVGGGQTRKRRASLNAQAKKTDSS